MKLAKPALTAILTLLGSISLSGYAGAQQQCGTIVASSVDSVTTIETRGLGGTTINVPVHLGNADSVAAFQFYMEYDSNIVKPVVVGTETTIDTAYFIDVIIDTIVIPPDTTIDTIYDTTGVTIDTFSVFYYDFATLPRLDYNPNRVYLSVVNEQDFPPTTPGRDRLKIQALPFIDPLNGPDTIVLPGAGNIMTVPFVINSNATVGTQTLITYWEDSIMSEDPIPVTIGCIYSQYTTPRGTITPKLKTVSGRVIVDEPPAIPIINSFIAFPDTIAPSETSTLSWDVSGATTISISPGIGVVTGATGSRQVTPTATTIYTLSATNADGTATARDTVFVITGPLNNKPSFSQPTVISYEIDQGQTVAFPVIATDADNDQITLTAANVPNNGTFGPTNPVIGVGTVSGNFSFTPDFNQEGTFQITFTASDGKVGGSQQLVVTIVVNELQFDRLFTTSAEGQAPVGGLAGTRAVLLPINMVTAQTVYGVQFDFFYDAEWFEVDSFITTPRTSSWVVYDNIGQTPGHVRVVTFGVGNEPMVSDTNTAILYAVMSIDSLATPGDYPIEIDSGWESVNPDPNFPSLPLVVTDGIIQVDRLGDVNLDQRVDVADAVSVVGVILGSFTFNPRQFAAGDVVTDTTIDVLDLVGIINLIFGIPLSPVAGQFVSSGVATVALSYPDLGAGAQDFLTVRAEQLPEQIAGVQIEVRYDPNAVVFGKPLAGKDATGMILSSKDNGHGRLVMLLYFKNPFRTEDLIQIGDAELLRLPLLARSDLQSDDASRLRLTGALLATPEAQAVRVEGIDPPLPSSFALHQNYPNPFNPRTTIEFWIGSAAEGALAQDVTLDIFNILGQHVKTLADGRLAPGNHRVEWDATNNGGRQVAAGIYLYRLQVGGESRTRKMLFLK
ncbi:MAG TPA: FlgD immunoglobulin-like domain containing protein [Candidatus Deferrimicrobium sp.]|nr:FlgD immunoglobulin-like domain containing protein [Candidatus Deferrimicrobium sp.]